MRVLVVGQGGQLAQSLAKRSSAVADAAWQFADRSMIDLAEPATIRAHIASVRPAVIVNAAAYTAVDLAESDEAAAYVVNGSGVGELGLAAAKVGAGLIHVSTDYVFDGCADAPYREDHPTRPINAYGRSKLAGEQRLRAGPSRHVILRTAWVYGPFGNNFVRTMLRHAGDRDELRVVDDQVGSPMSSLDLADAVMAVVRRWSVDPGHGAGEIYHVGGTGSTSWAGFARHVLETSAHLGGPSARVTGIPTSEYPTPARRPAYSCLDSTKFATAFGYRAPPWQQSVEGVVARLVAA